MTRPLSGIEYESTMQKLRILFQDDHFVVVDKPAGIMVHPPEDPSLRKYSANQPTVIRMLREQLGKYVYPVHRLDSATSGVLVLALESSVAAKLQTLFQVKEIQKTYFALVRGYADDSGVIDSPLTIDDEGGPVQDAITHYETYFRFELPIVSGPHATSRFSLVKVRPQTGRYHQIRRHFKRISHPLIGDTIHGDGKQNRIWREQTEDSLLYLKAYSLSFVHPVTGISMSFHSRWSHAWQKIFDRAGFCPYH
jgi:tRNA pseudouridine65 synthase